MNFHLLRTWCKSSSLTAWEIFHPQCRGRKGCSVIGQRLKKGLHSTRVCVNCTPLYDAEKCLSIWFTMRRSRGCTAFVLWQQSEILVLFQGPEVLLPMTSSCKIHRLCAHVCVCVCTGLWCVCVCVCVCLHRCVCMCLLHLLEGERLCNKFYQECEYVQTPEMECVRVCFIVIKFCICSSIFCALMRPLYSLYANPLLILWIYVQVLCHLDGNIIFDLYYLLWVICA